MPHDLRPFLDSVEGIVASHRLGPGVYRRWNTAYTHPSGATNGATPRDLGPNEYGIADAANILYTLGRFPGDPAERAAWIAALRARQQPGTGLFVEATHHAIHTTAHCIAALELFDVRPTQPVQALFEHATPAGIEAFLEGLDWRNDPWRHSHRGAGLYAALALTGKLDAATADAYFEWLWDNADPATGLWRAGYVGGLNLLPGPPTWIPHLAGSFHYLFNLEYARRPLRFPARLAQTCLNLRKKDPFQLCAGIGFAEIDWVYCLNRAMRQSGRGLAKAQTALRNFADQYIPTLTPRNPATDEGLNDLHSLFGAVCALAELQAALPGELRSDRPLRLVLDRRPFI